MVALVLNFILLQLVLPILGLLCIYINYGNCLSIPLNAFWYIHQYLYFYIKTADTYINISGYLDLPERQSEFILHLLTLSATSSGIGGHLQEKSSPKCGVYLSVFYSSPKCWHLNIFKVLFAFLCH